MGGGGAAEILDMVQVVQVLIYNWVQKARFGMRSMVSGHALTSDNVPSDTSACCMPHSKMSSFMYWPHIDIAHLLINQANTI